MKNCVSGERAKWHCRDIAVRVRCEQNQVAKSLPNGGAGSNTVGMERVANRARTFSEADEWDRKQYLATTPEERYAIAAELKRRAYGDAVPDIRAERVASKRKLHDASFLH